MKEWIITDQDIKGVHVGICDLNGIWRGKRLPYGDLKKLADMPVRMPLSATAVDIWGNDVVANAAFFECGERDGLCQPTGRAPIRIGSGKDAGVPLLPMWFTDDDGAPHPGDCRGALARVLEQFAKAGLKPAVGTELEFYLIDPDNPGLTPAICPQTGRPFASNSVLAIDDIDSIEAFLDDVYAICADNDVPAETTVSEGGTGQFEVTLGYSPDALKAADDTVFLKYILRRVARRHGMEACFMSKPFGRLSGSGFHTHFSLLDADGHNIFSNSDVVLRHAVGGLLAGLEESTLIFAPHLNSYRRFREDSLAPTTLTWGYGNRTAALRIPESPDSARRIEHRVSGADANPYMVLAAILGAALVGVKTKMEPDAPQDGKVDYSSDQRRLPATWQDAINAFEAGTILPSLFDPIMMDSYRLCKRQELAVFAGRMTEFEAETYRGTA
ncbi:MAG: glutamine synthetase family protein [Rhizobiaceae bacterium]|nr:glutamine synthetase family protein [Rhizobiaceae bacterium]